MKIFLEIIHLLVSFSLISVILMQHRKSGGFTGSFGGGTQADNTNGAWQRMTLLTKVTVGLIALFMVVSLLQVVVK